MGVTLQEAPPEIAVARDLWRDNPTVSRIIIMESPQEEARVSQSAWLRSRGNLSASSNSEKVKVSLTLDRDLVEEIKESFGGQALSAMVNELLRGAMAQERLAELVDEMFEESGPPSPEAYERVWEQWLAD